MARYIRTKTTKAKAPPVSVSEADFQQAVIELAHYTGWKVAHFRGVRIERKDGSVYYQTPVAADGKGFPDLVLAHKTKGRTIYAEIKSENGVVSPEQQDWLDVLAADEDNEVYVWRPSEWEEIQMVLLASSRPNKLEV